MFGTRTRGSNSKSVCFKQPWVGRCLSSPPSSHRPPRGARVQNSKPAHRVNKTRVSPQSSNSALQFELRTRGSNPTPTPSPSRTPPARASSSRASRAWAPCSSRSQRRYSRPPPIGTLTPTLAAARLSLGMVRCVVCVPSQMEGLPNPDGLGTDAVVVIVSHDHVAVDVDTLVTRA